MDSGRRGALVGADLRIATHLSLTRLDRWLQPCRLVGNNRPNQRCLMRLSPLGVRIGQQDSVNRDTNTPGQVDASLKNCAVGIAPIQQSFLSGFIQGPAAGHLVKYLYCHSSVVNPTAIMLHVGVELPTQAFERRHIDPERHVLYVVDDRQRTRRTSIVLIPAFMKLTVVFVPDKDNTCPTPHSCRFGCLTCWPTVICSSSPCLLASFRSRISARAKKAAALLLGTAEPLFLIQLAFGPLSRPSARACTAAERPAELQVPIRS